MSSELDDLVSALDRTWPSGLTGETPSGKALFALIEEARLGGVTSLPFIRGSHQDIVWLTFGPRSLLVHEYMDDVQAWLQGADTAHAEAEFVGSQESTGPLAGLLKALAPEGYFRWRSPTERIHKTLARLWGMHRFMASRPQTPNDQSPTLASLHLAFVGSLRIGDWERAAACIDSIDHWGLDHASRTLQMRIRLLDAQGAAAELFRFSVQHRVWELANPRRIATAILRVIDGQAIKPLEASVGFDGALREFRETWYPRVIQAVAETRGELEVARIQAFSACVDRDWERLTGVLPGIDPDLAMYLQGLMPPTTTLAPEALAATPLSSVSVSEANDAGYWPALLEAVLQGRADRLRVLMRELDSDLLKDVQFLAQAPEALLELLSEPGIESKATSRMLLQEAIAGLVDAFVMSHGFPRLEHLAVYLALVEGFVLLRGEAANDADSQVVLGLTAAVANLSPKNCLQCEGIVRSWWRQRPIVARLAWLAAALDSLAPLHPSPDGLVDLYTEGLELAARKKHELSKGEMRAWRRIGSALEVDDNWIDQFLIPLTPKLTDTEDDALFNASLSSVAIVSLQEASAREAAKEIAERTGAKVSVVTSLVSDASTRNAATADLILYVWAASTHATYRAFDFDRDRLEYVQGTGAASIVAAAERWSRRRQMAVIEEAG
ncbi:hypothetical protein QTI66_36010 [Variovorax sp. J22R133]|uniref:hypothetical protein n=1 Tax=Variovorax brevis TaxID=3053503 RepID=UPI0025761BE6|nr:hypothetical protein [Variovorax sp. J22R133]MDM0117521.1 hypothetical protein [Variovorax sp. J22R133]